MTSKGFRRALVNSASGDRERAAAMNGGDGGEQTAAAENGGSGGGGRTVAAVKKAVERWRR
jgi:hypothetical protein